MNINIETNKSILNQHHNDDFCMLQCIARGHFLSLHYSFSNSLISTLIILTCITPIYYNIMQYVPKLYDYDKRTYVIVSEQKFSITMKYS